MELPATSAISTTGLWGEEEGTVFLPTRGPALSVEVEGRGLASYEDGQRTPYILDLSPSGVHIRLTDWVGRLTFHVTEATGSVRPHTCLVSPSKLSPDSHEAFTALARLTDAFPHLTGSLHFPQELLPDQDLASRRPLPTTALLPYAARAWHLWQEARRLPRAALGHSRRIVHGGAVPDRVDWAMTLDHWGLGGFPDHVARDLRPLPPPIATAALHELWDVLIQAARLSGSPDAPEVVRRFQWARGMLPEPQDSPAAPADALTRAVQAMTVQVKGLVQQAQGLPQGWARMAGLYELWAMLTFAQTLGATEGDFQPVGEGLYEGLLHGEGLTVTLNPRLSFRGTAQTQRSLRPDILVLSGNGEALVADVKYRPLHRQRTDWQNSVDDQLLRYMGLSHARTGLVLWPAPAHLRCAPAELPGGRARLLRLRMHPLDTAEQRARDLQHLTFPGVN